MVMIEHVVSLVWIRVQFHFYVTIIEGEIERQQKQEKIISRYSSNKRIIMIVFGRHLYSNCFSSSYSHSIYDRSLVSHNHWNNRVDQVKSYKPYHRRL